MRRSSGAARTWRPTDAALSSERAAALWSASGSRWITDAAVGVPGDLVRRVVGLVAELDDRGAELAGIVPADGVGLLAERAASMGLAPSGRTSAGGAARLLAAADGWLAVSLARPDDVATVPAWLDGAVVLGSDRAAVVSDDDWLLVEQAVGVRSIVDLLDRAILLGLPCSSVGERGDDQDNGRDDNGGRGVDGSRDDSGGRDGDRNDSGGLDGDRVQFDDSRRLPGRVAGSGGVRSTRLGDSPGRPVEGALVVSLASLWAGPLCADILARLGARVVTVESTRRPDGGRLAKRFFEALHGHSESVALDLTEREGHHALAALLRRADVVIEGSRPRALEQMGIDARSLARTGPSVWMSITAHGRTGPARDRVGFGDDAAAAGGLVGWVAGVGGIPEPRFIADAVADPLTGLTAACAVAHLLESGGRWLCDVALARVAASAVGGWGDHGDEPVARPVVRNDPGAPMPLGADTAAVLHDLGVE